MKTDSQLGFIRNTEKHIFAALKTKNELIFNPETLCHEERETIIQMKLREDIYLITMPNGKWKLWKRIFN